MNIRDRITVSFKSVEKMDKMTKAMGRQWREEGKTNDTSMDERG